MFFCVIVIKSFFNQLVKFMYVKNGLMSNDINSNKRYYKLPIVIKYF
jgi:hypothetical protein